MIKVVAPNTALRVIDRAIQMLGGRGLTNDTPLSLFFTIARSLRLADGPDEVGLPIRFCALDILQLPNRICYELITLGSLGDNR